MEPHPNNKLHRNFAQLQEMLRTTNAFIESREVAEDNSESFYAVIEELQECIDRQSFEYLMSDLPCNNEEEYNQACAIKDGLDRLIRTRDAKMEELGYCPD